jgi:hypothetical protein
MHPNLIPLSNLRGYIAKITGILVSKHAIRQWLQSGEIKSIRPFGQRRKFVTQTELERFIERHTKEEDNIKPDLKIYTK